MSIINLLEKHGIMVLKGKNLGQRENWHRYWIVGTGAIFKRYWPVRFKRARPAIKPYLTISSKPPKWLYQVQGLNENLKMFISSAMPATRQYRTVTLRNRLSRQGKPTSLSRLDDRSWLTMKLSGSLVRTKSVLF